MRSLVTIQMSPPCSDTREVDDLSTPPMRVKAHPRSSPERDTQSTFGRPRAFGRLSQTMTNWYLGAQRRLGGARPLTPRQTPDRPPKASRRVLGREAQTRPWEQPSPRAKPRSLRPSPARGLPRPRPRPRPRGEPPALTSPAQRMPPGAGAEK